MALTAHWYALAAALACTSSGTATASVPLAVWHAVLLFLVPPFADGWLASHRYDEGAQAVALVLAGH